MRTVNGSLPGCGLNKLHLLDWDASEGHQEASMQNGRSVPPGTRVDGFVERVAAWVGKGETTAAAAAAGENGAGQHGSSTARTAPHGGGAAQVGGEEAGATESQASVTGIAVLGSEEGDIQSSERYACTHLPLGARELPYPTSTSLRVTAHRTAYCSLLQLTSTCSGQSNACVGERFERCACMRPRGPVTQLSTSSQRSFCSACHMLRSTFDITSEKSAYQSTALPPCLAVSASDLILF